MNRDAAANHTSATRDISAHVSAADETAAMSDGQSYGGSSVVSTPAEALSSGELDRLRSFAQFVTLLCLLAPVLLWLTHGDPGYRWLHFAGLAVGVVASAATVWWLQTPERVRDGHVLAYGLCCAFALVTAFPYFGEYSVVVLMIPIGSYVFGLGRNFAVALTISLSVTLPYGVWSVLIISDVVEPRGIFQPVNDSPNDSIIALVLVQFIWVATFSMARKVRAATLRNLEQLHQTVRDLAKREALLEEARAELDRVARIGGDGRYTGQVLDHYELGVVIGRGAMGEVYEAKHTVSGESCAVKLLLPSAFNNLALVQRFRRELEIAAALDVVNVVKVLELPNESSPLPYLAMEHLQGNTLGELLIEGATMSMADVVTMVAGVGAGLTAAHAEGIVHRDIKPQNIFRHDDGTEQVWKVLDFGISKLADGQGTVTAGNVVGTPAYMSPEQAMSKDIDHRSDVYSLAVVAYRAMTGRPAFSGRDTPSILYKVVHETPPPPSSIADVSPRVDAVIAKAMAKLPQNRYASVAGFVDELRRASGARAASQR